MEIIMIYVLLADGFEEVEAITPIDIMRRAGLDVLTVSMSDNPCVTGAHNIPVIADINIDEVNTADMELLMLPGGPGHTKLDGDESVQKLITYAAENGIYIAAICASPSIIGKRGLLQNRQATSFPGYEKYLHGARISPEKAVSDGKFITARGAGASAEFGFLIVSHLLGEECAAKLRESMQY